jgi:hypothetical protein
MSNFLCGGASSSSSCSAMYFLAERSFSFFLRAAPARYMLTQASSRVGWLGMMGYFPFIISSVDKDLKLLISFR